MPGLNSFARLVPWLINTLMARILAVTALDISDDIICVGFATRKDSRLG